MSKSDSNNYWGLLMVLLTVAFVVLKLCHVIDWSWWFVTMPLWGGFALSLLVYGIVLGIAIIVSSFNGSKNSNSPTMSRKSKLQERMDALQEQNKKMEQMKNKN